MTALARFLVRRGVRVIVVSAFGDARMDPGSEVLPGVIAIPVKQRRRLLIDLVVSLKKKAAHTGSAIAGEPTPAHARTISILRRLQSRVRSLFFRVAYFVDQHKEWSWRASQAAICAGREYGARLVLSSSPPFTTLLTGRWVASRLDVPHIADYRDPWTDAVSAVRPSHRLELRLLRLLESWALRPAAAITSTTSAVAKLLLMRYPAMQRKLHVVRNGYEGEPRTSPPHTGGRLAILFAGELYLGRNPFPLLTALETLLARPDVDSERISLALMGKVASYNGQSLASWMRGKRCGTIVKIVPQAPQDEVSKAVSESTLLLNLAQEQPLSVPAKTFEHLACGREILLLCENDSETASLVAGIGGVKQVDPRDTRALDEVLLDIYRRHVTQGWMTVPTTEEIRNFSRESANESFWSVMSSIAKFRDPSNTAVGASQSR